jgi:hypothetical protein
MSDRNFISPKEFQICSRIESLHEPVVISQNHLQRLAQVGTCHRQRYRTKRRDSARCPVRCTWPGHIPRSLSITSMEKGKAIRTVHRLQSLTRRAALFPMPHLQLKFDQYIHRRLDHQQVCRFSMTCALDPETVCVCAIHSRGRPWHVIQGLLSPILAGGRPQLRQEYSRCQWLSSSSSIPSVKRLHGEVVIRIRGSPAGASFDDLIVVGAGMAPHLDEARTLAQTR